MPQEVQTRYFSLRGHSYHEPPPTQELSTWELSCRGPPRAASSASCATGSAGTTVTRVSGSAVRSTHPPLYCRPPSHPAWPSGAGGKVRVKRHPLLLNSCRGWLALFQIPGGNSHPAGSHTSKHPHIIPISHPAMLTRGAGGRAACAHRAAAGQRQRARHVDRPPRPGLEPAHAAKRSQPVQRRQRQAQQQ